MNCKDGGFWHKCTFHLLKNLIGDIISSHIRNHTVYCLEKIKTDSDRKTGKSAKYPVLLIPLLDFIYSCNRIINPSYVYLVISPRNLTAASVFCVSVQQPTSAATIHPHTWYIFGASPPPPVTHQPLISIIINICLFNFQLCQNGWT